MGAYRPLTAGRHAREGRNSGFSDRSRCSKESRRVELGGPRQRSLLALLLLHANEVVSSSRLDRGAVAARGLRIGTPAALQASVSRLRKSLGCGAELLVTLPTGYVVRLAPDQLDLRPFERPRPGRRRRRAGGAAERCARRSRSGAARRSPISPTSRSPRWRSAPRGGAPRWRSRCGSMPTSRSAGPRARPGARGAGVGASSPRAPARPADARALPVGRQAEALDGYQAARRALATSSGSSPGRRSGSSRARSCATILCSSWRGAERLTSARSWSRGSALRLPTRCSRSQSRSPSRSPRER